MTSFNLVFSLGLSIFCLNFHRTLSLLEKDLDSIGQVVFVNVLYRHGDRTPIDPYPNDPYKNASFWPVGWGQLTNKGKRLHFERGQWLKTRYGSLLSEEYKRDEIFVQSTDVDRTLMSAESSLAGMYPPRGGQVWYEEVSWQPIPVHTIPERMDKVLAMKQPCKKYDEELYLAKKSPEMVSVDNMYKGLYKFLTLVTGKDVHDVTDVEYVYSTLHIEQLFYFTLPTWTKKIYPEPMRTLSTISFKLPTLNKQLKRLKAGPLLGEMLGHFKDKMASTLNPDRKMWIYSAHDTTVANLLNTLGVFNDQPPPYAATVLMELRKSPTNNYFVTLLYKNVSTEDAHVLKVNGCDEACPVDKFVSLFTDLIPEDWETECHSHYLFDLTSDLPYNSLAIFAMVTSTLLVFLLLASTSLFWHKQTPAHLYRKLKMETL